MVQRSNYAAAVKDVQIKSSKEECALSMEQRGQRGNAAAKDVQIMLSKEEFAKGMEQRKNYAAVMDVQIKSSVEEYAGDMGRTAIHTMNLLLLDQNTTRLP
jgi:hypothetical protein